MELRCVGVSRHNCSQRGNDGHTSQSSIAPVTKLLTVDRSHSGKKMRGAGKPNNKFQRNIYIHIVLIIVEFRKCR